MRAQSFTTRGEQPYGRSLGRSLDALDTQDGWGVADAEPFGPFSLDKPRTPGAVGAKYEESQARLRAKLEARAAAKAGARANAAEQARQDAAPSSAPSSDALAGVSVEGAKAAWPYLLGGIVLGAVVVRLWK